MDFAAICGSHSPVALTLPEADPGFAATLRELGPWMDAFKPDLIIQFAPDHYNGFFYDIMPNFCLGVAAESVGDWGTPSGPLSVPEDMARAVLAAVRAADIDLDVSLDMQVDHGTTQLWGMMLGGLPSCPIIPIVINCAAPPRPALRRARLLGEAVGRFASTLGLKVLFAGSGGLSHDPPLPAIATATGPQREFLLRGRNPTPEAREAREARVRAAAASFAAGTSPALALNREWDAAVLDQASRGALTAFDSWSEDDVTALGGCGGHEIRCWIAALAALQAASGPYDMQTRHYAEVPEWMTAMGIVTATPQGANGNKPNAS